MGSSLDGVAGSGSIVDWPFLSMILSAADPEPDSLSFSESSPKVKMVLPFHWLINGLFGWDVSLQLSSRISGSPPLDAYGFRCTLSADVVRISWTLFRSRWCEQRLARRKGELLVLLVEYPVILLERTNSFWSRYLSFASDSLDAQTCSLIECSQGEMDAAVIIVNVVGEALDGDLSVGFHS